MYQSTCEELCNALTVLALFDSFTIKSNSVAFGVGEWEICKQLTSYSQTVVVLWACELIQFIVDTEEVPGSAML